MSKSIITGLIFLNLMFLISCTKNKTVVLKKNHIEHITLKLEKKLDILLTPNYISDTETQISTTIKYENNIDSVDATWTIVNLNDETIFKAEQKILPNKKIFVFESVPLTLPDMENEYKIILQITAQSENEKIVKTKIHYTKSQEEIDEAIKNLQERSSTPGKL